MVKQQCSIQVALSGAMEYDPESFFGRGEKQHWLMMVMILVSGAFYMYLSSTLKTGHSLR